MLLDGSRVVQSDRGGTVNIGVFPTALIKKVDIVTGGASAQYGADAVGGVVNFILDRNFEGFKASASTGVTEVGDGFNHKASLAGGMRLGEKLHVVGSAEYTHIDQIQRDPDSLGSWFQRLGFVTNPGFVSATATPGVPVRRTLPNVVSSLHSPTGRIDTAYPLSNVQTAAGVPFTLRNTVFLDDGSGVRPFISGPITSGSGGTQSMSGGSEVAPGSAAFPGGPYGARVNEKSAFLGLKYDINDKVNVFGHAMYGSSRSDQLDQRGLPHLQDIWFATIYSGNPFLPGSCAAGDDGAEHRLVQDAEAGTVPRCPELERLRRTAQRTQHVHLERWRRRQRVRRLAPARHLAAGSRTQVHGRV